VTHLLDEQAALRRVATLVAARVEPDELFSAVAEEVARLLAADAAAVARFDPDGSGVVVGRSSGLRGIPLGTRAGLGESPTLSEVHRSRRPARWGDEFYSSVAAPITVEGRLWGVLTAGSGGEPLPSETEERLEKFGELLATAIANAESRAALAASEARARELAGEQAALRRVATLVARGASPDQVFSAVADEVAGIIDIPVVGVHRYEADRTFTILGIAGETKVAVGSRRPVDDWGVAGMILATGRPARTDGDSTMPAHLGDLARPQAMVSTVGVPIVVEGEIWGFMAAVAKPGTPIPAHTEAQLARFTELVATAVSNATTRSELLTSRARVVSAADETRRRLERDLHDGIQQWLVALALRARKAARLSAAGEAPVHELSRLADDLVAVTDELRELSRGIHPAILSDAGLDDALEALARRSPIRVDLVVSFQGRFDPTLEATVYYVVAESITNAVKHAQASTVAVRGGVRGETIELEIADDGVGGADPARGTGLIGLKDRVDTLGGTVSLASPAGVGTTIRVRLPAGAQATPL
jgi:signal transduction histidine kinase